MANVPAAADVPASAQSMIALLRTHSLTEIVQVEIERMILSGELPAGTRLKESVLASKLCVSRGPVREACRALAELGFVHLVRNRGVFVRRLEKTDAIEVFDLRAGLTGLAGLLLAPKLTKRHVKELHGFLHRMDRAAKAADFATFYPLNLEFHDFIVRSTENGRLLRMYRGLVKEFHLFRSHGPVEQEALMTSAMEHRAIVEALESRDGLRAYEASFEHVANGKQRMLTALDRLAKEGADASDPTTEKTKLARRRAQRRRKSGMADTTAGSRA